MKKFINTFFIILPFMLLQINCNPVNKDVQSDIDFVAELLINRQYNITGLNSFGAIRKCDDPETTGHFLIIPYFGCQAASGMLKTNHPKRIEFAKNWLKWYFEHLKTNIKMVNHFYKEDGTDETTCIEPTDPYYCNFIDAEDSEAALLFQLCWEYFEISKDTLFFNDTMAKMILEKKAKYMVENLMNNNNLFEAKNDSDNYYLMDNCEVYSGFLTLAKLEKFVFKDYSKSNYYNSLSNKVKKAINQILFNRQSNTYLQSLNTNINTNYWYNNNGMVVILWPQLFGIDPIQSPKSIAQRDLINKHFRKPENDWTKLVFLQNNIDESTWPSVGYIFGMSGDKISAKAQSDYILKELKENKNCKISNSGDLGFLLKNLVQLSGAN